MESELKKSIVEACYGEGTFDKPELLIVNPADDPKDWRRKARPYSVTVDDVKAYSDEDLCELLTYLGELWAQWRISNSKASILRVGQENKSKAERESADKAILAAFDSKNDDMIEMVHQAFGRSRCIEAFTRARKLVPTHPLLQK
jgi:hypothetical protein